MADIAFSFVKADGSLLLPETLIQTATSEDDDITITVLQEKLPRNSKPKTRKELDQEMMRREK